jgi:hypothetical protein
MPCYAKKGSGNELMLSQIYRLDVERAIWKEDKWAIPRNWLTRALFWFLSLLAVIFIVSMVLAQQPGQIGSYQGLVLVDDCWATTPEGYRFVPQHWAQAALFSDRVDAEKWYVEEYIGGDRPVKVVDRDNREVFP